MSDSGEISDQLDQAQLRWPEVIDRKELLLKSAAAGCAAIEGEEADRGRAVEETAGVLAGVYDRANWSGYARTGGRISSTPVS